MLLALLTAMLENKRILKSRYQVPSSQQRIEPIALVQSLRLVMSIH